MAQIFNYHGRIFGKLVNDHLLEMHTITVQEDDLVWQKKSDFPQTADFRIVYARAITVMAFIGVISLLILAQPSKAESAQTFPISQAQPTSTPKPRTNTTSPEQPAAPYVGWTPYERDFGGVAMMLVPGGCFEMGSNDIDDYDEQPEHHQCFDKPFWIDKYEVTQGQFQQLGGTQANVPLFLGDDHPVDNITWFEARDFCELRGGRLPTEREWEYTARGPDSLFYPWGNEWNDNNAVWWRSNTEEVGSILAGASWVGALDITGNVSEWTSSLRREYPYDASDGREDNINTTDKRVHRGDSWVDYHTGRLRTLHRFVDFPAYSANYIGFRCARDFTSNDITDVSVSLNIPAAGIPPEQLALKFFIRNVDWTPYERDFDGVAMMLVPEGCFEMGASPNEAWVLLHAQCFDKPFWIDKYEVTQAQFQRLGGTQAEIPEFSSNNHPVENITWFEARDFCESRGGRLPTEREWEYAARGPDGLIYPWGNEWKNKNAVWSVSESQGTEDVGSIPAGMSWVGALDMSGNVSEWTSSLRRDYPYDAADGREDADNLTDKRTMRGGSWYNYNADDLVSGNLQAYRPGSFDPHTWRNNLGFRCARDFTLTDTSNFPKAEQLALAPVFHNADWTPYQQQFNRVTMVLVPVGCFEMGRSDGEPDELPAHQQCISKPFWIDKYEVRHEQFGRLGGTQANSPSFSADNRPVENVNWFEARDFCELRGGRLPTEREWEYAARGPEGALYGSGSYWINAVWNLSSSQGTANVGSIPTGVSWVGALDMSGNVWEWTSSLYQNYPYDDSDGREDPSNTIDARVLRGGAWNSIDSDSLRAPNRFAYAPNNRYDSFGFRCARDFELAED